MTIIIKILIFIANIIYSLFRLFPTKNKIVMISRQSNKINDDFRLLGKELEKSYQVVYLCRTLDGGINSKIITKIAYIFHMFRQMYHLATSKVCILDSYCILIGILKKKKNLTVIQIWHSIGTMKKCGYSVLGKEEGSHEVIANIMGMHKNYDVVYVSSKEYIPHLKEGFNVDENIFKIKTLPRIDLLTDEKYKEKIKKDIYEKYPSLKEKENIIYAPTFRKNEYDFSNKLNELVENIDLDKYNLILKLHPLSKVDITNDKIIIDKEFRTSDMFFIADKVITDYSCVFYEACILEVPVYFYFYDYNDYEIKRGLAIDINELPGYISYNIENLIHDIELPYNFNYLKKFTKKYISNTKDCTKKMVEDIKRYM